MLVAIPLLNLGQELVSGFIDHTNGDGEASIWSCGQMDINRAFEYFLASSHPSAAQPFLEKHLLQKHEKKHPGVSAGIVSSMLGQVSRLLCAQFG